MSCCGSNPGYEELDEVSKLVTTKLAAFLKTLRDSGFAVGPREGQDAASLMAAGYAAKPGLLRSAFKHLFAARKSDWDRFDGLFDAFWLGKRARSRSLTVGSTKAANSPSLKSLQERQVDQTGGQQPDQIPSGDDDAAERFRRNVRREDAEKLETQLRVAEAFEALKFTGEVRQRCRQKQPAIRREASRDGVGKTERLGLAAGRDEAHGVAQASRLHG